MKNSITGRRLAQAFGCMVFSLALVSAASAAPITGDPVGNDFGWSPNSTNELNYLQQVPGREGQTAPYVLLESTGPGFVTLDFYNNTNSLAFFEVRLDGQPTGTNPHPVVIGDTIHEGIGLDNRSSAGTQVNFRQETLFASLFVDIRLALGGERDWDFDWVRFEVEPSAVPTPAPLALLAAGLLGGALLRRRRRG